MKEQILRFMKGYPEAKEQPFANSAFGVFIRTEMPDCIYETGLVDRKKFLITGSVGQGNWATIPWIAIFDRSITTTAQKGIYIVYLLSSDSKRLYLSFNQGCTEIKNSHSKKETIRILEQIAQDIRQKVDSRGFSSDQSIELGDRRTGNGVFYEKGDIFHTVYNVDNLPDENTFLNDLKRMMESYKDYVKSLSTDIRLGTFDSWTIVDENTAVKNCDKSFFDYNGSGIPKEICWFFGAEEMSPGHTLPIKLLYDGNEFTGLIRNESKDHGRKRLFWQSNLGNLLVKYRDIGPVISTFRRIGKYAFEINIEEKKKEMPMDTKIGRIKEFIAAKGFSYTDHLIENFYLSLKSKPFVILAGTSGTGKTRLVRLFAEAIGAVYEQVPVRPDWSDSTDLFGHLDLNGQFVAGKIIDFLWSAQNNPEKPFILCLDEMNLARVEYYLSDFLSVIETREFKDGKTITDPLVSRKDYGQDIGAINKYGDICFPENLYIVGTVNMDETTFPFSRKVLDRANTIEFNFVDLMPIWSEQTQNVEHLNVSNGFLRCQYLQLRDCPDTEHAFISETCDELERINRILQKANAHIGYRVRDEIVFYLLNNKEANLLDNNTAMDNEIMQKILPRIQGSSVSIKEMLCELFKEIAGDYDGYQTESNNTAERMLDMLRKNNRIKYPKSAEKIAFMVRRFEEDGFTSYWL